MVTSGDFISGKKKTGEEPGKVNTMYTCINCCSCIYLYRYAYCSKQQAQHEKDYVCKKSKGVRRSRGHAHNTFTVHS